MDDELDIQQEEDDAPSSPFWMTTYSDMVTLLLTFFVLIVSMSEVELVRFKEALSFFNGRTSVLKNESVISPPRPEEEHHDLLRRRDHALDALARYLRENGMEDKIKVHVSEKGVHVSIVDSVVFASGRAEVLQTAKPLLTKVGEVLTPFARHIVVEGHTDNRPISTSQFPSNWELSGARAASVVRFFLLQSASIHPRQYRTIGHGEFHPVASNRTAAGRARNRRVEILFNHAESD